MELTECELHSNVVDHVLAFMISGVCRQWKQPIVYTFCEDATETARLVWTIMDIIRAVHMELNS